jgi:universal stress protein A
MQAEAYRHLLLATDLSPESETLTTRARDLTERYGARLSLIHVVEYVAMEYAGDLIMPEDLDLENKLVAAAREQMDALGETLDVAAADRHVEVGSTKAEILRVAEEQDIDLIVIGSHGRHGLALLLGSTANAVLHGVGCDVLAVRI